METIRERAKNRFPTVLLTLLSIVQALALELMWEQTRDRTDLYELSGESVIGWLQIAATLDVIILIWLAYVGMVLRFSWTPNTADSIWPFFVGLIQFQLIEFMGPGSLGKWLVTLAVLFATMVVVNHAAMKRARQDESNSEFFSHFNPATIRDFVPAIISITVLVLAGALLWQSDTSGWIAAIALVVTFAGLGNESRKAARYWRFSMGETSMRNK